ncbi:MAG TPA: TRAP transporter small permease [Burkholderiales bacterium]|jgi:TRAP-type C4-dicarboxylate transport system permease small subunit|nr:TRAP transporter small permease [Burkholderiales bacterium]
MHALAAWAAIVAGAILAAIAGMVVTSVALRALGLAPVQGDFELVQVGLAACIALFLPWCQLRGSNIIVDFFTTRARIRTQRRLDAFAALLVALMMALVAWRAAAGAFSAHQSGETTMILGFPIWWSYAAMTPGLALTAVVALFCVWRAWREGTSP